MVGFGLAQLAFGRVKSVSGKAFLLAVLGLALLKIELVQELYHAVCHGGRQLGVTLLHRQRDYSGASIYRGGSELRQSTYTLAQALRVGEGSNVHQFEERTALTASGGIAEL